MADIIEKRIDGIDAAISAGQKIGELLSSGIVNYPLGSKSDDGEVRGVGTPFVMKKSGFDLTSVEHLLDKPVMARSVVAIHDAASFAAYVNAYKDANSVVFADLTNRKFEAVIDYHKKDGARWGKHRVTFAPVQPKDWLTWMASNSKQMPQVDFARFVENNIPSIGKPDGATLLEMCITLEAKSTVDFRSATRLQNGQVQIRYEETIEAKAGGGSTQAGTMTVPNDFAVIVAPFQGVEKTAIEARFRYNINGGALKMWYELVRPEDVLQAAFDTIVTDLKTKLGDTLLLAGTAPAIS